MAQSSRQKKATSKVLRASEIMDKLDTEFRSVGATTPAFEGADNHTPLLWDYFRYHRLRKWSIDYLDDAKSKLLDAGVLFDGKINPKPPGDYLIRGGPIRVDLLVKQAGKPTIDRDLLVQALEKTNLTPRQIVSILNECSKPRSSAYEFTPRLNIL